MLESRKAALTGGVSAGKTAVGRYLRELGATYISADEIVHQILGEVDRKEIAAKVFKDPQLLAELEAKIHPQVKKEIKKRCANSRGLVVVEIPLLFEVRWEDDYDATIAVISDEELCKARYKGDDYSERTARQLSMEEKAARADYTIINNGTLEELHTKTETLFNQLTT